MSVEAAEVVEVVCGEVVRLPSEAKTRGERCWWMAVVMRVCACMLEGWSKCRDVRW